MAVVQGPDHWRGNGDDPSNKGGDPPDNGDMEHRVTALETRLDTVLPMLATKTDMAELRAEVSRAASETHRGFSDMVKWIVGVSFTGLAVVISAMTFLTKPLQAPQTPNTQPIIINVPPAAAQAAPTPSTSAAKRP